MNRFSAFMKKQLGKTSAQQPAHSAGQSAGNSTRKANWHLIPDEFFADIKSIVALQAQSTIPVRQQQGQASVAWDDAATLAYLNDTDADGIAGSVLRGMKSNFSDWDQWSSLNTLLKNFPMMKDQGKAASALSKTWAASLCGCKYTPPEIMNDSQKISLLYSFTHAMEHLETSRYIPENYHTDAYKKNAKNLQRAFFNNAVPKDLYATLTRVLPVSAIPSSLFSLGRNLGFENGTKCQEAKAADLTELLEEEAGLYSYIDGDKARSRAARRVVEWRFTHVEGNEMSSVLDMSGCNVDRVPPIARLRDLPAIDSSRSDFGAFRQAELTEVNASGNRFSMDELKVLRNLGLRVHVGNNTPPLNKRAINRLNWLQRGNNKTTFTLEAPKRLQPIREHQLAAKAPSRESELKATPAQETQGKTAVRDFAAPQSGRTSHDVPSPLRPSRTSALTQRAWPLGVQQQMHAHSANVDAIKRVPAAGSSSHAGDASRVMPPSGSARRTTPSPPHGR